MKIILLGYMASGKSSVGKVFAEQHRLPFIDLDSEIEKTTGLSIPEIFDLKGNIFFRQKEQEVLKSVLALPHDFVLATGGGMPCYGTAMRDIKSNPNTLSVYLKASISTLTSRIFPEKSSRPLVAHLSTETEMQEFVGIHLFERTHWYNQADITIQVDGKTVAQIASEIAGLL